MEFPALMPRELHYCEKQKSEEDLLAILMDRPMDLLLFFETASSDETWSEEHPDLMHQIIVWLTSQAFQDRLAIDLSKRAAKAIHEHRYVLEKLIPQDIQINLSDESVHINSLLFVSSSHFFRNLLLSECRDNDSKVLTLAKTSSEDFAPFKTYIENGEIPDLFRKSQDEILNLLFLASSWRVEGVIKACELSLKRYITQQNAIDMLLKAHHELWPYFKQECIEYMNGHSLGFRLGAPTVDRLSFEFYDFSDDTMAIFHLLCHIVTDLICRGSIMQYPRFKEAVRACTRLIGLDISNSLAFNEALYEVPRDLQEIHLAECTWLQIATLKIMAEICPYIRSLNVSSNYQLNTAAWRELTKFKGLKSLNLSRCHQITDDDLVIILKASTGVTDLILDECGKIGDRGFFELAKSSPRLNHLSLVRCSISDSSLLEIASRCRALTSLDLSRCELLTEKGFKELAKHAQTLKELNVTRCQITPATIHELRVKHPQLNIID